MLQSVTGEIGRASPVVLSAVRFLYDEDLFGVQGENSAEDSFTISEISPLIEYSLTSKTTLRAEGTWRQVTPGDPTAGRTEYILTAGIACATSVKTTIGIGTELGHIRFDQAAFGEQNYGQGYVSMAWQAAPKIRFQTSVGAELREFDSPTPKPDRVSPVATVIVNWLPDESTRINVGFRVRNQPSVSFRGSTFQEIRLGADAIHEMPQHFYLRGEAAVTQRKYDTGARELETTIRPAVGYRTNLSRLFDSLNVEFFYHFRLIDSNQPAGDRERNLFGIESTLFF
jgi:hypothetical protein